MKLGKKKAISPEVSGGYYGIGNCNTLDASINTSPAISETSSRHV
jgi:hypothetical protein